MGFGGHTRALQLIQEKGWAKVSSLGHRPTLLPESEIYWNAWRQLHKCRVGANPLTVSDIYAWMEIHDVQEREDFFYILLEMEEEWRKED